jgi:hypothetical protein
MVAVEGDGMMPVISCDEVRFCIDCGTCGVFLLKGDTQCEDARTCDE